jgi:hypothetical protein
LILRNNSLTLFFSEAYNTIMKPFNEYPTGFSCWVGKDLYFGISKPKDIEILLNRCLTKGKLYKILHECFNDSLVVAPGLRINNI